MRKLLQKQSRQLRSAQLLRAASPDISTDLGDFQSFNPAYPQIGQEFTEQFYDQPESMGRRITSPQIMTRQADPSQNHVAESLKRVDADLKKGLLDKTGDGANANIIKLGEQMKGVADGLKELAKPKAEPTRKAPGQAIPISLGETTPVAAALSREGRFGVRDIQYDEERIMTIREQGLKYIPGIKEGFGLGVGNKLANLGNMLKGDPLKDFKLEDIDENSLFGGAIKRRMAEKQYAEDQLSMSKTLKGEIRSDVRKKKEYQDESGKFSEKIFKQKKAEQFREQNKLRGEIGKTLEEIDRLKYEEGYDDERIKKTGLYKTLQQQETQLAKIDPERFGKAVKEAKQKDIERAKAKFEKGPVTGAVITDSNTEKLMDTDQLNVGEVESERQQLLGNQMVIWKQIEENTRPLKELGSTIEAATNRILAQLQQTGMGVGGNEGESLLDTLGDPADGAGGGKRRKPRGTRPGRPIPRSTPSTTRPTIGQRATQAAKKAKDIGKGALSLGTKAARFAPAAIVGVVAANTIGLGAEALGVGEGVVIDEQQDEANWQKMTVGEKMGSGIARGFESVGSFLGLESFAKEASAARITKESKIVKGRGETTESVTTSPYKVDQEKATQAYKEKLAAQSELESFIEQNGELELIESNEFEDVYGYKDPEKQKKLTELQSAVFNKSQEVNNIVSEPRKKFIADYLEKNKGRGTKAELTKDAEGAWSAHQNRVAQAEGKATIKDGKASINVKYGEIYDEKGNLTAGQMNRIEESLSIDPKSIDPEMLQKYEAQRQKMLAEPLEPKSIEPTTLETSKKATPEAIKPAQVDPRALESPVDIGGRVYQDSDTIAQSNNQPKDFGATTNIVNAPSTNINQTSQYLAKPSARNTDSTFREYNRSRFV